MVRLDVSKNELLVALTIVAVISTAVGSGSYLTGAFGMNLDQTIWLQPVHGSFAAVLFGSFGFVVMSSWLTLSYIRAKEIWPRQISNAEFRRIHESMQNRPDEW
jgi:Mg2+ and Co2+ transporter CorA